MTPHPVPTTPDPTYNNNYQFYYESYVAQDPSWNLVASGWIDASGTASGSGEMLAATYNLPVQTRVWNEDGSPAAWGPWLDAVPAGGAPDKGTLPVTPPAAGSSNGLGVAAGVALAGLVAFLVWPR